MKDMKRDHNFQNLQDLSSLLMKLVEIKRDVTYPFVFFAYQVDFDSSGCYCKCREIFSGMTFVDNKLRNRIDD